ncbi:MAG: CoA-binding protein [Okeania sp. SIO2H7]|nr:CoA-binding protein [Okeania sp. SIO2H7]
MNLTSDSKVLVQGLTKAVSTNTVLMMKSYGTNVVAGVSIGEGGGKWHEIPVFDLVEQAQTKVGPIDTSVIVVPPYSVLDAASEAIAAGIRQIAIITDGVPPLDMVKLLAKAEKTDTLVVGPNCAGIIVPNKLLLGSHPAEFYTPGSVGIISRSNTLSYEVANELTRAKLGQSICASIGSDEIIGSSFIQWLQILDEDEDTDAIVLVGEVGSGREEAAASYIAETIDKPAIAYIAGIHSPVQKTLSHANNLMSSRAAALQLEGIGTAESIKRAFKAAKIPIAERPSQIPSLVKKALKKK